MSTPHARVAALALVIAIAALPPAALAAPAALATVAADPSAVPSPDARAMADWVIAHGDAHGLPFVIVDKRQAQVVAFDAAGALRGATPALLGVGHGDISPPGIGTMKLADITPEMRITPAGRFEAGIGHDLGPKDVLWVDYDAAIALHRVVTTKPAERRLERLASPTVLDNRISYGCINVPVLFYEGVIQPLFQPANGIVYILPETAAFGSLADKIATSSLR